MTENNSFVEFFKTCYLQLDKNSIELLDSIYSDDVVFVDPLHRIEGLSSLKSYFADMYENVIDCQFSYLEQCESDKKASIFWQMRFSHSKLNKANLITVDGCTLIHYHEKVYYHRDYFDAGQMLYEHIPFFGLLIKVVKNRVAK